VLTLTPQGHYDFATGSSLAAAGVSGIVALMRARRPQLDVVEARDVLTRSTRSVRVASGAYRAIDACAAVSAVAMDPASATSTGCREPLATAETPRPLAAMHGLADPQGPPR
jgi:subtilisin family serine protease